MTLAACFRALAACPLLFACSLVNSLEPCEDVRPDEERVNEQGDGIEFLEHPRAAVEVAGDRVAVVFGSQSTTLDENGRPETSVVRLALLSGALGVPVPLGCLGEGDNVNRTLTDEYSSMAFVARADLDVAGGRAVALVGWFENTLNEPALRMTFVDAIGCPLRLGTPTFTPYPGLVYGASAVWSAARRAVLLTFHDQRDVYRAWVTEPFEVEASVVGEANRASIYSAPVAAIAGDGRSLVTWIDAAFGIRGTFLDAAGNVEESGRNVDLGFPEWDHPEGNVNRVTVTAGADRYAVLLNASGSDAALPPHAYVREFALDGSPLGPARRIDTDDTDRQSGVNGAYLPSQTLLATFKSATRRGTAGRLFGGDGHARFNTLSCSEKTFAVGTRERVVGGWAVPLAMGDEVWVLHGADLASDTRDGGVARWRLGFRELWPAE